MDYNKNKAFGMVVGNFEASSDIHYRPPSMIKPGEYNIVSYNPNSGHFGLGNMYGNQVSYNTRNDLFNQGPTPLASPYNGNFGRKITGSW